MTIKTFDILKMLENQIHTGYGLSIFKGYKAIDKYGVEKIIDELYSNLPEDVKQAREYLKNQNIEIASNKDNIYDSIKNFEIGMDSGFSVSSQYVIIKVREIENLLNQIYKNLPNELIKAKNMDK